MTPTVHHRQAVGATGEALAAEYLAKNGYTVLERNFKARYGEIDIVARNGSTTIFVEVKTRISLAYGLPEESVTPRKLREVIQTAQYYMALHTNIPDALRIDVIAILLEPETLAVRSFEHIPNVTL